MEPTTTKPLLRGTPLAGEPTGLPSDAMTGSLRALCEGPDAPEHKQILLLQFLHHWCGTLRHIGLITLWAGISRLGFTLQPFTTWLAADLLRLNTAATGMARPTVTPDPVITDETALLGSLHAFLQLLHQLDELTRETPSRPALQTPGMTRIFRNLHLRERLQQLTDEHRPSHAESLGQSMTLMQTMAHEALMRARGS